MCPLLPGGQPDTLPLVQLDDLNYSPAPDPHTHTKHGGSRLRGRVPLPCLPFHPVFPASYACVKSGDEDFPGGPEGKNLLVSAEDTGSIPGLGGFFVPQSS